MGKTKTFDTSHGDDKKEKGGNRLWLFKTLPYSGCKSESVDYDIYIQHSV